MKKVIIYTRVSKDYPEKNGLSLPDQEQSLRAYCTSLGYTIITHFEDEKRNNLHQSIN